MKKIGLISDTHGYMDEEILGYLQGCDEIWHAGDIGDLQVTQALEKKKPLRAVHGNIDDWQIRQVYRENERFMCGDLKVWLRHITGTPRRYTREVYEGIAMEKPDLLVGGHTHITRVERDDLGMLYLNPGAIGRHGIHRVRTLLRFAVEGKKISQMEVVELPR